MGAYPHVADRYVLLPHGASMGFGYGPIVVAREPLDVDDAARAARSSIPGRLTTAYLVLRLALGDDVRVRELPFDQILDEVASGRADAGLLIHEGQLTYGDAGLHKVLDLGEWWQEETGLPLPLGVNAARRDLGERLARRLGRARRGDPLRPRPPRRGARLRRALRARHRPRDDRPLRRDVRQRADRATTARSAAARSTSCCGARARASRPPTLEPRGAARVGALVRARVPARLRAARRRRLPLGRPRRRDVRPGDVRCGAPRRGRARPGAAGSLRPLADRGRRALAAPISARSRRSTRGACSPTGSASGRCSAVGLGARVPRGGGLRLVVRRAVRAALPRRRSRRSRRLSQRPRGDALVRRPPATGSPSASGRPRCRSAAPPSPSGCRRSARRPIRRRPLLALAVGVARRRRRRSRRAAGAIGADARGASAPRATPLRDRGMWVLSIGSALLVAPQVVPGRISRRCSCTTSAASATESAALVLAAVNLLGIATRIGAGRWSDVPGAGSGRCGGSRSPPPSSSPAARSLVLGAAGRPRAAPRR